MDKMSHLAGKAGRKVRQGEQAGWVGAGVVWLMCFYALVTNVYVALT